MITVFDENILIQSLNIILEENKELEDSVCMATADEILIKKFGNGKNLKNYNSEEYEYRALIYDLKQLKTVLEFFKKFSLIKKQTLCLKFHNLSSEQIIKEIIPYKDESFINNLYIRIENDDWVTFEDYFVINYILNSITDNIKLDENLSPLEKILKIYNSVKKREYREVEDDKTSLLPKKLSSALLTDYIVCVGYVKIFNALLKKCVISCVEYGYKELKDGELIGHEVSLVNIDDDKYNIHGLYFFDPTMDSYKENDERNISKYSGFMQTIEEYRKKNITVDSFEKVLLLTKEEITEAISIQNTIDKDEIDIINPEIIDGCIIPDFNSIDKKTAKIIDDLLEIDYELFKNKPISIGTEESAIKEQFNIYPFLLKIVNRFGSDISVDSFINLLFCDDIRDCKYYYNAYKTKFLDNGNDYGLDTVSEIVNNKLK